VSCPAFQTNPFERDTAVNLGVLILVSQRRSSLPFDVIKGWWQEAGITVADVTLRSGQNDDVYADMLLETYLEGANL